MLELSNVSRNFGGLQALSNVTMRVPAGKVVGLIGPNGAGKTTMINNISGLDHPTSGHITYHGKPIHKAAPHRITRLGIARTYQNIRLFNEMSVAENLLVGQHIRGTSSFMSSILMLPHHFSSEFRLYENLGKLLERFELTEMASVKASNLPYGAQRRLEMARALATQPSLMLLDEPTAGMNPTETHTLGKQILQFKEDGLSVLVIEHDMSLIHQVCDEVYVLNFGQIIAHGTPDEIRTNQDVIDAYLGTEDPIKFSDDRLMEND